MSVTAKLYIAAVLTLGAVTLANGALSWRTDDPVRFSCYLVLSVIASALKFRLPGITGTMSASFLFLLAGVAELGLAPTLLIGTISVLVQCFWRAKVRPRPVQLAFSIANVSLAIWAAHFAYTWQPLPSFAVEAPFRLAAAATAYFFVNTLSVALVIALTERKTFRYVWESCYSWSFAYYLAGAAFVGVFSFSNRMLDWQAWLLIIPVVVVVYRSYRLYLERLDAEQKYAAETAALHARAVDNLNMATSANARLDAVIQASPLSLMALDNKGAVTAWNASSETIFGWTAKEVLGKCPPFCGDSSLAGQQPCEIAKNLVSTTLGGEPVSALEAKLSRKDGSCFDAAIWTAPVPGAPTGPAGVLVSIADVSDRKRLEKQLRLSQKMEAVGRLAGGVAHDFNNLLTVINGYSAMLAETTKHNPDARKEALEILSAGNRAAALVAQLLTFSRHQILSPQVLELNRVVRDIERMLSRVIGEHITLQIMLGQDAGCILADRNQIETVLINMVTNSRDAMPEGGVLSLSTSRVDVAPGHHPAGADLPAGSYVRLVVSDTGHGMDAHTQQHLFEPFFTTKEVGKGTGLGLSSAYAAVQKYGGRILVKSELGVGTAFSIYLPRCEQTSSDEPQVAVARGRSRGNETVLLVEDDKMVRRLARDVLTRFGYRVLEASQGGEALERFLSELEHVDLVVTDVVMPVMNGVKLAQELRKQRPDLKVIFISGHAEDTLMGPHMIGDVGLEFIPKPFHPELLASKVRAVLDESNTRSSTAN